MLNKPEHILIGYFNKEGILQIAEIPKKSEHEAYLVWYYTDLKKNVYLHPNDFTRLKERLKLTQLLG